VYPGNNITIVSDRHALCYQLYTHFGQSADDWVQGIITISIIAFAFDT